MKKHFALLAALLICTVMGLSGCANNSTPSETNSPASTLPEKSNPEPATQEPSNNDTTQQETDTATTIDPDTGGVDTVQQIIKGDFAIHNTETGKNIRPYNSGTANGNDIILYPHNEWKCLTWQFNHVDGAVYQLQNVYTRKTFEPMSTVEAGVALWQQPLSDDSPKWEFIEQEDGAYAIRMVDTDLYITISSDKTDSPIILMPYEDLSTQHWKLIEQYPTV